MDTARKHAATFSVCTFAAKHYGVCIICDLRIYDLILQFNVMMKLNKCPFLQTDCKFTLD